MAFNSVGSKKGVFKVVNLNRLACGLPDCHDVVAHRAMPSGLLLVAGRGLKNESLLPGIDKCFGVSEGIMTSEFDFDKNQPSVLFCNEVNFSASSAIILYPNLISLGAQIIRCLLLARPALSDFIAHGFCATFACENYRNEEID